MTKLKITYSLELMMDDDEPSGAIGVMVLGLEGCFSQGSTVDEAIANAQEAIEGWVQVAKDEGQDIPKPPKHPKVQLRRYRSEWLSASKAGKRMGISSVTVRKIVASGELIGYRFGKEIRIREGDLDLYFARSRTDLAA